MKLSFLELNGFRGYRKRLRIDFASGFTIIDGRNGVGKSTVFDAIEFALTGALGKYEEQKASGETFADYLWWRGEGPPPSERFVTVGFCDSEGEVTVTRREFQPPEQDTLRKLSSRLCDIAVAPADPLSQLCASAIIRDEQITKLSLDLKETDRYALLRDALGANDSDSWIERAARLVSAARRRITSVEADVTKANDDLASASRRLDEARSRLVSDSVLAEAVARLRLFVGTEAVIDELIGRVREHLASVSSELEILHTFAKQWSAIATERERIPDLSRRATAAVLELTAATNALESLEPIQDKRASSTLSADARSLVNIVALGRSLGRRDGHCPLCWHGQSHEDFEQGMRQVEDLARQLDADAAFAAENEQAHQLAVGALSAAASAARAAELERASAVETIDKHDQRLKEHGFDPSTTTLDQVQVRLTELRGTVERAQADLRVMDTLHLGDELERALRNEVDAKSRLSKMQEKLARTRKAEASAQTLHDATRRAAAETLDRRLERVLPLMSELYRRLRPHPFWNDIEYSIRGDIRRFLRLQVGQELNPQFLFSSGQRRATGLAFLLSVNLSLAWSRLRTVLLDDPVQHIDDFRTVHLAELLAKLVAEDRQVVCAVEDAALADLLCRRLPIKASGSATRVSLGPDDEGALTKLAHQTLTPLRQHALALGEQRLPDSISKA
jgi:chromosome segregation protein